MSRTKTIYFLSAFVLIIGCFALNKSYSLFTQNIESDPITATVPKLDVSLSMNSITVEAGKEYLIKQTVTNNSVVPVNFGIITDKQQNVSIAIHSSIPNNLPYGVNSENDTSLAKESSKDIYLVVSNKEGTEDIEINFELSKNYTSISTTLETLTNINEECKTLSGCEVELGGLPFEDKSTTLTYKIIENFVNSDLYEETTDEGNVSSLFSQEINKLNWPLENSAVLNVPSPTIFTGVETEEVGLYKAEDDYGTSYYYRGAVRNNYVNFAGFTWRIVRINGDGTIRLILDKKLDKVIREGETAYAGERVFFNASLYNDNAYIGYMYGLAGTTKDANRCVVFENDTVTVSEHTTKTDCENNNGKWTTTAYEATHANLGDSTIKDKLDLFYEKYIENDTNNYHYKEYLSDTIFCGDKSLGSIGTGVGTTATYYGAYDRLIKNSTVTPTLKCAEGKNDNYSRYTVNKYLTLKNIETNGDLEYPIALLSADELVMAGAFKNTNNLSYYLYDETVNDLSSNTPYLDWWTMTPDHVYSNVPFVFYSAYKQYSLDTSTVSSVLINGMHYIPASGVRPVINLRSDILWAGGDGTSGSPYTVSLPPEEETVTFTFTDTKGNVSEEFVVPKGMTFSDEFNNKYSVFGVENHVIIYNTFYTDCYSPNGVLAAEDVVIESTNYTCRTLRLSGGAD